MDSLQNILDQKKINVPAEITMIKKYILERYKSPCTVRLNKNSVILSLPNSALTATVHMQRLELIQECGIDKKFRLIIRTGR